MTPPNDASIHAVRIKDAVHVTIAAPAERNGLDPERCAALSAAIRTAGEDDAVRFLVIHGTSPWFCIGADTATLERTANAPVQTRVALIGTFQRAVRDLLLSPLLTIAVCDGLAAGAGADLMLAADLVLVGRQARLGLVYATLGLVPDCGFDLLTRRFGAIDSLLFYAEGTTLDQAALVSRGVGVATAALDPPGVTDYARRRFRHRRDAYARAKALHRAETFALLDTRLAAAAAAQAEAFGQDGMLDRVHRIAQMQRALGTAT